jgi:NAD(P)-dependent dehydrogenase (short-subunit alcohol dehydrogenase family)
MDYILAPLTFAAKNFSVPGARFFLPRGSHFSLEQVPDLSGKVALVTGGSEGIGYACTKTLLDHNVEKVFVLSVKRDALDKAMATLSEPHQKKVHWIQCDLSKWETDTVTAADKITSSTSHLDIVINNAARGIMLPKTDSHGIDLHLSTNHIGHVVLMSHLLPLLKKTASEQGKTVRIVQMASMSHEQAPPDTKFDKAEDWEQGIGIHKTYARTKLANILYTRWMSDRLPSNILINATHPGVVNTPATIEGIHEPYPILGYGMSVLMYPFKKSPEQGAISAMFAATMTNDTGKYITPPAQVEPGTEASQDREMAQRLMDWTYKIIAENTDAKKKGCPLNAA